jgi:V/A-type H+-transporting ATPase subunit I
MALFLLVEMIPPTVVGWVFRVILLVLGSALILMLDVLAVAVQTIRLEFYEGLSRYYRGDGQVYQPLQFQFGAVPGVVGEPARTA